MLGDFINRCLMLLLGYAYPAFECYKAVEKNKIEIDELRFWCQYWILVAFLSVFERVGDIFISWLPMYGEMKLALIIYLWYPKTKGTGHVYNTFLRPIVARHETDIERKIQELKAKAWDFVLYYWQNFAEVGQSKFFDIIQYLLSTSVKLRGGELSGDQQQSNGQPRPGSVSLSSGPGSQSGKNKKWPPTAPPPPDSPTTSQDSPTSRLAQTKPKFENNGETGSTGDTDHNQARFRLRRTKPDN
ncbi:hypothetical protein SLEP1_g40551 [Rubroshorea leprosula]|uniref:HVA22-like protein n=1 Tax=Rubroshorea leprosula TaxID=152421 RepID=A0AAV5L3W6_9ROSI|nr:hypothetical protein SLEP1_g40551 [Rubroshorea leprosula]